MKVLFLHPNDPDYLISGLFHGLRKILGKNCVDLPRFDGMYKPYTDGLRNKIRGRGFTLFGLLDDIPELAEERFFIWYRNIKDYDLYIIADIWNTWRVYSELRSVIPAHKIIVIDPSDTTRLFPFVNFVTELRNKPSKFFVPIHKKTKYFKREWTGVNKDFFGLPGFVPSPLYNWRVPKSIFPINFSIPAEKITTVQPSAKNKLFVSNIVDEEVSEKIPGSVYTPLGIAQYKFDTEEDYFNDIKASKYGITTRRAGWDCLRHYEYAANGAVLCFKRLQDKPATSAPHRLNKDNCIIYDNYDDLTNKISRIDNAAYEVLLNNTYTWIRQNTTEELAKQVLEISMGNAET